MLKQLVQLFAEKFLVSKKEWLFKNSFSFKGNAITVADQRPGTAPITYTAPSNGLLSVRYQTSEGISLHWLAIASVTEVTQQDGSFLRITDGQLKTHFMYLREKSSNLIQTTKRKVLPECGSTRRLNSAVGGASC